MKNVIIAVLVLCCVGMAWWIFTRPPQSPSPIEQQAKENVRLEVDRLNREIDKKGIETVIMEETNHVLSQAGVKTATDSAGIIDSLQKLANNRLISWTQARAEIKRLQAVMDETDSTYTYRDKWLTVDVTKPQGGKPALLSSTYNAELNWMWYNERKRLLGIPYGTKTYGRFWLNDPNATITGLKHLRIEPPKDRLGFSVQAIGDYAPSGNISFGVGATIRTGRLSIQGAYMNDFRGGWRPAVRGSYNLIEF